LVELVDGEDGDVQAVIRLLEPPTTSDSDGNGGKPVCPSALALFNLTGSQDDATSNLLRLFAQVESASSVLAWSSSSVRALGSECEVSIVQLHRINARFDIKANEEGTLRLQSAEYEGLFVRDDHHVLSLRRADQMWGPSQRASSKATLAATGLVR